MRTTSASIEIVRRSTSALTLASFCAVLVVACSPKAAEQPKPAATTAPPADSAMKDDVAHLKEVQPSQSHTMMDVGFHMANMWFAAKARNWPLTRFYFNETRQHIRWTVRVRPVRKDPAGQPVDLKSIFDAMDTSTFEALKQTIEQTDAAGFETAYKHTLEACYSCHKASGMPFLRPTVPTAGPQPIINLDPNAKWPE